MSGAIGRPATDIAGRVFGRLTALTRDGSDPHRMPMWRCSCTCGDMCRVRIRDLFTGYTRSCGCLRSESTRQRIEAMNGLRAARSASLAAERSCIRTGAAYAHTRITTTAPTP